MTNAQDHAQNAAIAVERFVAHVSLQDRERQKAKDTGTKDWVPSAEMKAEREKLLRDVLLALGCTRADLLNRLQIDRATWDRWRLLKTVPQRMHLEALLRFAHPMPEQHDAADQGPGPDPMGMLARGRKGCTWGRLRLTYSFFPWENAVFWYPEPFNDAATVTEMALLALRGEQGGCCIIYLLREPDGWAQDYIGTLQAVLGRADAARVLSRICIVKLNVVLEEDYPLGFGLFNYMPTRDSHLTVGYEWKYTPLSGEEPRPRDDHQDVYAPIDAGSEPFTDITERCGPAINIALGVLEFRRNSLLPHFWAKHLENDVLEELLTIPVVIQGIERKNSIPNGHFSIEGYRELAEQEPTS